MVVPKSFVVILLLVFLMYSMMGWQQVLLQERFLQMQLTGFLLIGECTGKPSACACSTGPGNSRTRLFKNAILFENGALPIAL